MDFFYLRANYRLEESRKGYALKLGVLPAYMPGIHCSRCGDWGISGEQTIVDRWVDDFKTIGLYRIGDQKTPMTFPSPAGWRELATGVRSALAIPETTRLTPSAGVRPRTPDLVRETRTIRMRTGGVAKIMFAELNAIFVTPDVVDLFMKNGITGIDFVKCVVNPAEKPSERHRINDEEALLYEAIVTNVLSMNRKASVGVDFLCPECGNESRHFNYRPVVELEEDAWNGDDCFRVLPITPVHIVSMRVKALIESNGIEGARFVSTNVPHGWNVLS